MKKEDVHKIWHLIQVSNRHRQAKSRRFYIISTAVAASIVLFFYIKFHFTEASDNRQDIRVFANNNIPVVETTETQLFVSDNKIISLPEKESAILYDSASIKVTSHEIVQHEISKNEVADFNQLIIPKGKRSFLTLADGTQIWINSGTRLVYPSVFPDDKREIFVDGEIYIDVQPDYNRPFIVQTSDMNVRVLGTEFNVQAYQTDGQKRVVLKSGSVKISSDISKEEIVLQPAEMYEATGTNVIVKPVDINNYISWIEGMYICESERLDYILTRLSRYYGKEITVDKKAAGLKCNGKLDLKESLNDVLTILKYIVPIDFTSEKDIYAITYKP
ncbi:FecR domain-containing protein [uncultured Proteiniphilum sp.]|uniref:FecR family protein n=1 Tax=uncultured Proteiniphilum sp. TaxID=497637 RepID=UPI002632B854|nr:FecR domain-containing protein [uncultured Proteiniphilum sp.]